VSPDPDDPTRETRPPRGGGARARDPQEVASHPGDFEGFLFWRASLRWQRMITGALKPFGLTHVQWMLLVGAWMMELGEGREPSQRELAEHNATDVMMTSQVLAVLEKRGLVVRRVDPADRRVRRVTVTPEGVELARHSLLVVDEADSEFFAQIGSPGSLIEPLRKLAAWEGP
jgi:DNA-binding MarR family transcriptional regulator